MTWLNHFPRRGGVVVSLFDQDTAELPVLLSNTKLSNQKTSIQLQ